MRDLEAHQTANRSYIEEGVQLREKRKLLDFVLSNCTWKGGELTAKYRQPFDVLALAVSTEKQRMGGGGAEKVKTDIWLPTLDTFRTLAA